MTNDPLYTRLREQSWRRKLTPAEEAELRAWLATHAETQADWEAETALSDALEKLPDAPVPSNFTAVVLQTVEREQTAKERPRMFKLVWSIRNVWLTRAALAAVVVGAGLFSYLHSQTVRREEMRTSVVAVSAVKSLPSLDALQNFDVIRAMDQTPPADEQLLTLLQ